MCVCTSLFRSRLEERRGGKEEMKRELPGKGRTKRAMKGKEKKAKTLSFRSK